MSSPKALKLLLRVRRRRVEQLKVELQLRLQEQDACETQRAQADAQEARCRADEDHCQDKILALEDSQGFHASDVVALQHVLDTLKGHTRQAAKAAADAAKNVQEATQKTVLARQGVWRAEKQAELIGDKLRATLQAIERELDDGHDEEAEEAAVARMLAAARESSRVDANVSCGGMH